MGPITQGWVAGRRALLFSITGIALFVFWLVRHPTSEMDASMTSWPTVSGFSATLLLLAISIVAYGKMIGGSTVVRMATLAGAAVGVASIANIFEDGLGLDVFFFAFIISTLVADVALLVDAVAIVRNATGRLRWLALVPIGTLVGILAFVTLGGPLMLVTWLEAAAVAILVRPGAGVPAAL